ncbi:hypothetical protein GCM10022243_14040 [Saccharothrix violaceirubra]|uniref:Transcriptional regulator with XRE-family HTH domain n=1 Tax=Saccharothrix violaceirubra TaxID=413306 RepID=A0A7W7WY29_9PSEU|nr:helix-turn-helix transcriptional regulator [Saccharothrix violaceirubra]MBB4967278.1 transcriptional regulator with XRE-family HTH domain [Saccharothrix violaceirubra]
MTPPLPDGLVAALPCGRSEPGVVVRAARAARGWSQADLGRRCGYSASQVSRWETGRLPLRDVGLLRILADVLALPHAAFGLSDHDTPGARSRRPVAVGLRVGRATTSPDQEDDPVRRRALLAGFAALAGSALVRPGTAGADGVDPAQVLTRRLGDALLGPAPNGRAVPIATLTRALASARHEFSACRYLELADRLPTLLGHAEATAGVGAEPGVHRVLAAAYQLATRALIKLRVSGLEWLAADRAARAANLAADPLVRAESQRLLASVARRAGDHDRALALTLAAADDLVRTGREPARSAMVGSLYCSAGYAAARAGDRERARELLGQAGVATAVLVDHPGRHRAALTNLVSHQVSAAYLLGDAGAALAYAHSLPLAAVPTTERRARLLVDTALAYARWDKPDEACRALLTAERVAPGEVRTRNAVRLLVSDLMAAPRQAAMPGLSALARRVHLPA